MAVMDEMAVELRLAFILLKHIASSLLESSLSTAVVK